MTRRKTASVLAAALWLATPTALWAATAQTPAIDEDAENAADAGPWTLALGLQGDRQKAYGFTSALGYDVFRSTTLRASAHGTEYQGDLTLVNPGTARALAAGIGVTQRLGHFGLDADLDVSHLTALMRAVQFKAGGTFTHGPFTVGLRGGYQRTTFDIFTATTLLDLGAGPVLTPVAADCKDTNTSFGADGRWQGRRWGAHASLTKYQYKDVSCNLVPASGTAVAVKLPGVQFAQLASAPLAGLQKLAMPVIGDQQSLPNSTAIAGISWRQRDFGLALDYLRQRDHFVGTLGKAYFATGSADLGGGTGVDVTFGDTRGAGGGARGLFGGLGVRARF